MPHQVHLVHNTNTEIQYRLNNEDFIAYKNVMAITVITTTNISCGDFSVSY